LVATSGPQDRIAGDISARAGEARDKAGPDRIANRDHDDGNCRRCLLGRLRRRRSVSYDDVHGQLGQFRRGRDETIRTSFHGSVFNGDVPAFYIAKVA